MNDVPLAFGAAYSDVAQVPHTCLQCSHPGQSSSSRRAVCVRWDPVLATFEPRPTHGHHTRLLMARLSVVPSSPPPRHDMFTDVHRLSPPPVRDDRTLPTASVSSLPPIMINSAIPPGHSLVMEKLPPEAHVLAGRIRGKMSLSEPQESFAHKMVPPNFQRPRGPIRLPHAHVSAPLVPPTSTPGADNPVKFRVESPLPATTLALLAATVAKMAALSPPRASPSSTTQSMLASASGSAFSLPHRGPAALLPQQQSSQQQHP